MTHDHVSLVGILLVVGSIAVYGYEWLEDRRTPERGTTEWVDKQYREERISRAEMARRKAVTEDPQAEQIRETVEQVPGIADEISWWVAYDLDSTADLETASEARLREIPSIGPQRAAAIREYLDE